MEREEEEGKLKTIEKEFRPDPNDDPPLYKNAQTFTISKYADGESPPVEDSTTPSAANPKRFEKPTKKDQHSLKQNETNGGTSQQEQNSISTAIDDLPIGGSNHKFTIPEFADAITDSFKPSKPRNIPKRFQKYEAEKNEGKESKESTTGIQPERKEIKGTKTTTRAAIDASDAMVEPSSTSIVEATERIETTATTGFDDEMALNIGQKKTNMMSEFPEGADEMGAFESGPAKDEGPLSKRIVSKVVKTRMTAFEELAKEFERRPKDRELFTDYEHDWEKRVSDLNPGVQEQACLAFKQWITLHPSGKQLRFSENGVSIARALIEKCLAGGKTQVVLVSKELLLLVYEKCCSDVSGQQGEFFEMLNGCVKNKNAKIVCAGVEVITDLLVNYGPKKLEFMKPFFGEIEKQSLSTNAVIRAACIAFFKEAMKWLGETIVKNYTKNLKQLQLAELDKFYAEWDKTPLVPLKASEEDKKLVAMKVAGGSGGSGSGSGSNSMHGGISGGGEIDLYDIADAVDIFTKFNERWCDKLLGFTKWTEKKEGLEELITAASQPKVSGAGFMPVVGMVKRLLNDANSVVQICAVKVMGCLAKSMRKSFAAGVKSLYSLILIRFREKKTLNTEETRTTIDNFWYAIALEDVTEVIRDGLLDKAPPMKQQVMQVIERYFAARPNAIKSRDAFKAACLPTIKKLFDDSSQEVREDCLMLVGKLNRQKDWFTQDELNMLTAGLNEQKKAKISRGSDNPPEISSLNSTIKPHNLNPSSGSISHSNSSTFGANSSPANGSNASSQIPSKPRIMHAASAINVGGGESEDNLSESKQQPRSNQLGLSRRNVEKQQTGNDLHATIGSNSLWEEVSSSSIPNFDESQDRLRGFGMEEEVFKVMSSTKSGEKVVQIVSSLDVYFSKCLLELLVFLEKVAFKSSILAIQKEVIALVDRAASHASFSKPCFHVCSELFVRNLSDPKFNAPITGIIEKACEKLLPKYVVSRLIRVLKQDEKKGIAPKAAYELSRVIANLIDIASLRTFNLQDLMAFAKESISNTNVTIKAGGIEIIKKVYEHIGEAVSTNYLKDIPLSIQGTLSKEYARLTVLSEQQKAQRATMKFSGDAAKFNSEKLNNASPAATATSKKDITTTNNNSIPNNSTVIASRGIRGNSPSSNHSYSNNNISIIVSPDSSATGRGDISKDASERIQKKLSDLQWKTRKEGLDELDALIEKHNNRIVFSSHLLNLIECLKVALNESNKGVQRQVFTTCGRFVEACGRDVKPHTKPFIKGLISNLTTKEAATRKELMLALDRFEKSVGGEFIINCMPQYLAGDANGSQNQEQRSGIIEWILRHEESYAASDLHAFVVPILLCLSDKSKDIRVLAESLFEISIAILSPEPFKSALKDYKPAVVQQLSQIIQRYSNTSQNQQQQTLGSSFGSTLSNISNMMIQATGDDETDSLNSSQGANHSSTNNHNKSLLSRGNHQNALASSANNSNNNSRNNSKVNTSKVGSGTATPTPNNLAVVTNANRTLHRNATTVNLNSETQNSNANGGDRTPVKIGGKSGGMMLIHSHSSNKLTSKQTQGQQENNVVQQGKLNSTLNRENMLSSDHSSGISVQEQQSPSKNEAVVYQAITLEDLSTTGASVKNGVAQKPSGSVGVGFSQTTIYSLVDGSQKRGCIDESMVFPLTSSISNLKAKRSAHIMQATFDIVNPSNEHFEFVINELKFLLNPTITSLMFSFNYACLIQATEEIKNACEDHMQVSSLKHLSDLLFQWCFMRVYGNFNVEVCLHVLDTLRTILLALSKEKESLSDLEIGVINACIRECLINLPETSSVYQQIFVILNLQIKMLTSVKQENNNNNSNSEKVLHFWLNQLNKSVEEVHPKYFELESINKQSMQQDYMHKLCEVFAKSFLKDMKPEAAAIALPLIKNLPFTTPRCLQFLSILKTRFTNEALISAGFTAQLLSSSSSLSQQAESKNEERSLPFINEKPKQENTQLTGENQPMRGGGNQQPEIRITDVTNTSKSSISEKTSQQGIEQTTSQGQSGRIFQALSSQNSLPLSVIAASSSSSQSNGILQSSSSSAADNIKFDPIVLQVPQQMQSQQQQQQRQLSLSEESSSFLSCINNLSMSSKQSVADLKLESLQQLQIIVQDHEKIEYMRLFEEHSDAFLSMLRSHLKYIFDVQSQQQQQQQQQRQTLVAQLQEYTTTYLNLMYKCFCMKQFPKLCNFDPLKKFTEELLVRLLAEDQKDQPGNATTTTTTTTSAANNSSPAVRILNSTMLRILENARPEIVVLVLMELLVKYRGVANSTKLVGLIIKCLLRVVKALPEFIDKLNVKQIFAYFHKYLVAFLLPTPQQSDDVGVKSIKTILKDLCKLKGQAIWDYYYPAIQESNQQDFFINEWISLILNPQQQISGQQSTIPTLNSSSGSTAGGQTAIISNQEANTSQEQKGVVSQLAVKETNSSSSSFQQQKQNLVMMDAHSKGGESHGSGSSSVASHTMKPLEYENLHNKINEFKQRIVRKEQHSSGSGSFGTNGIEFDNFQQASQSQQQQLDKTLASQQQQQSKVSDELLQKVIDMKGKLQNVMSPPNDTSQS